MLYKRLDNEVRNLSQQELRWLLEGLSLQQPKAIANLQKVSFNYRLLNDMIIQNKLKKA